MKIINSKKFILIFLLVFLFFPLATFAAKTSLETASPNIKPADQFELGFFLNTEGEEINALEGKIVFPKDLLVVKSINSGNSIINFWVEKPKLVNNEILFSGVIPGAYSDQKGLIFSVIFQSTKAGLGTVKIGELKALLSDGKGTSAKMTSGDFNFTSSESATGTENIIGKKLVDNNPPENFTLQVATNPLIFEGRKFLVFLTQDKESGIDFYEVKEGEGPFNKAESPYLLKNQDIKEIITVKAVDRAGNVRLASLPIQEGEIRKANSSFRYLWFSLLGFLIFLFIVFKVLWRRLRG